MHRIELVSHLFELVRQVLCQLKITKYSASHAAKFTEATLGRHAVGGGLPLRSERGSDSSCLHTTVLATKPLLVVSIKHG